MIIMFLSVAVITIIGLLALKAIKTALTVMVLVGVSWYSWHTITSNAKVPEPLAQTVKTVKANATVKKLASDAVAAEKQIKQSARDAIVGQVDALLGTTSADANKQSAGEPVKTPPPQQKVEQLLREQHAKLLNKPISDNVLNTYFQGYPGSKEMFELFKEQVPNANNINNAFLKFYENLDSNMRKPALSPQEIEELKLKIKTFIQNHCDGQC